MHRRHAFLESVPRTVWGAIFMIYFRYFVGSGGAMLKKAADLLADDMGRGVRCQRSGREADLWPEVRRTDLSMHASNGHREGTSKIVFPSSRRLRRLAAQESGGSITGSYEPMGTIPFNRSRGRLAAGKASDRSGVVVRHTTTSRVLGGWILRYRVGAGDLLLKRAGVLSPGDTGRWARCQRSGRQTD